MLQRHCLQKLSFWTSNVHPQTNHWKCLRMNLPRCTTHSESVEKTHSTQVWVNSILKFAWIMHFIVHSGARKTRSLAIGPRSVHVNIALRCAWISPALKMPFEVCYLPSYLNENVNIKIESWHPCSAVSREKFTRVMGYLLYITFEYQHGARSPTLLAL